MIRKASLRLLGVMLAALGATLAQAQEWPQKPVRIVVPTAPGGSIDLSARLVANHLQQKWGQPVIVENRAGAAMRIGADAVAKARPDGYTLLFAHDGAMAMNVAVFKSLPYDPVKDFEPLAMIASLPLVLMVHEKVPVNSVRELVALARKNPGSLNHASGGTATLLALDGTLVGVAPGERAFGGEPELVPRGGSFTKRPAGRKITGPLTLFTAARLDALMK